MLVSAYVDQLEACWVQNQGGACTTAAVLAALGALGAQGLPPLEPASIALGASAPLGAPGLLDYVSWPARRAPLDLRIEALGARCGIAVSSRSRAGLPGWPPRLSAGTILITHLAWGQEAPDRFGAWGWNPVRPATYSTGGHSVVLAGRDGGRWLVLDPNHPGLRWWPRAGIATAMTRIRPRPS